MMEFARSHLISLGWSEGGGLGRERQGTSTPLRAHLKFDTSGLGHDPAADLCDSWWSRAYDRAASRLVVESTSTTTTPAGCTVRSLTAAKDHRPRTVADRRSGRAKSGSCCYGRFVRGGVLHKGRIRQIDSSHQPRTQSQTSVSGANSSGSDSSDSDSDVEDRCGRVEGTNAVVDDETLLRLCEGRTAHRGSNRGVSMSGKLARIAAQEAASC